MKDGEREGFASGCYTGVLQFPGNFLRRGGRGVCCTTPACRAASWSWTGRAVCCVPGRVFSDVQLLIYFFFLVLRVTVILRAVPTSCPPHLCESSWPHYVRSCSTYSSEVELTGAHTYYLFAGRDLSRTQLSHNILLQHNGKKL